MMGTHLRVLSESYAMNTNMTGFRWFSKIIHALVSSHKVLSGYGGTFEIHKPSFCMKGVVN